MQFTNLVFVFVFLPILLLVYYCVTEKYRRLVLVLFSLFFYACGSPEFFLMLFLTMIIDIGVAGRIVKTREKLGAKWWMLIGILYHLCILAYYKYSDDVGVKSPSIVP